MMSHTDPIPPQEERRFFALGLRLMSASAFSIMSALIKVASEHGVSVPEILFWRQAGAAPLILIWVLLGPGLPSLRPNHFALHVQRSALGLTSMTCMFLSVSLLPLAEATTLGFTMPIFATILSAVLIGEAVGRHRWTAVILGFVGVLVIVRPGGGHFPLGGVIVGLMAAFLSGMVSVRLREMGKTEAPATTAFWFSVLSLLPLGMLMPIYAQHHSFVTWSLLAGVGIAGAIGQLCMTNSLKFAPVSVVVGIDYVALLWSTFFGWAIWGYLPSAATWIGAPVIIASGLYIAWREHRLRLAHVKDVIG